MNKLNTKIFSPNNVFYMIPCANCGKEVERSKPRKNTPTKCIDCKENRKKKYLIEYRKKVIVKAKLKK